LNYGNISTTQAIQQTLSVLLQKKENNLPKDLRNKAQALVAEVESLLPALRVLQLCETLKNLPHTAPLTSLDNIILNLEQNQQTLSVLLQKKGNKLPEDLRNEAQALVGKVKDLEALALCNNLVDWSSVDPTQLLPADIDMIENDLNALIAILPSLNISESVIDTLETLLQELKEISQNQDPNYILILNPLSRALEDLKLQIEARLQSAQTATSGQEQGGAEAEQH